ncbi:MAG: thioredoxin fold domain-containing protein [Gammaproteobacteria bacterium]|nr:thioredoxin fold domain-containing protein [Gammaproteobacteria bacterium]
MLAVPDIYWHSYCICLKDKGGKTKFFMNADFIQSTRFKVSLVLLTGAIIVIAAILAIHSFVPRGSVEKPSPPELPDNEVIMYLFDIPDWFAGSFLKLPEDVSKAAEQDKLGLILYFGRENCPCCELMQEVNFEREDIVAYIQAYFDVIAIDAQGEMTVTDFDGKKYTEARFAKRNQAEASPSMLFFNTEGKEIFRLRGYQNPYELRTVLDYVTSGAEEEFEQYLRNLYRSPLFSVFDLHDHRIFSSPPYNLARVETPGERPLAVFFEKGNCPGCDFLHNSLLVQENIVALLAKMDVAQLNITSDMPLVTPDGQQTTAREWVRQLDLYYTPALLFFDLHGKPVSSISSSRQLQQLEKALQDVLRNNEKITSP